MIHQKDIQEEIIIFTRYPRPGRAKTRLMPELGAQGAATLQRTMTEGVVRAALELKDDENRRLAVYYTDGSQQQMRRWLGPEIIYSEQVGSNLGVKMQLAFQEAWNRGAVRAVIIGSDCPALNSQLIGTALEALKENQLVLGPSTDGGYYLIGTTSAMPITTLKSLLTEIPWGTSDVFQTTTARAREHDLTLSLLKELHDIDLPSDLAYLDHHPNP